MHGKRFVSLLAAVIVCSSLSAPFFSNPAWAAPSSMHPVVMGVYDEEEDFFLGSLNVAPIDTQYMSLEVWNLLDSLGADSVQREFPAYGPGDTLFTRPDGKEVRLPDLSRLYLIYFQDSVAYSDFQPLYNDVAPVSDVFPNLIGADEFVPVDLSSAKQIYLFELDSAANAIDAVTAWDVTTGDTGQVLCVTERGLTTDHYDFDGRNLDGFSYDPLGPWDEPSDHGLGVSSVLMANAGDSGMVGMNHKAKLFVIRHDGTTVGLAKAAIHAIDSVNGEMLNYAIRIQRNGNACQNTEMDFSRALYRSWLQGLTITASQGNDSTDNDTSFRVPSGMPGSVAVGGLSVDGIRVAQSNWGNGMKVLAPGEAVYRASDPNWHRFSSGTSLAAPMTGGALSLIRAANPKLIAGEAEELLYQTATDIGATGYDKFNGWGKINVGAAVARADTFSALFRTNATSGNKILKDSVASKFIFDCVFGSVLPSGTYTNVAEYQILAAVSFPFNHKPIAMIRTRSVEGWPMTTVTDDGFGWAGDTVVQFPWARVTSIDSAAQAVVMETGAYWISDDGNNPAGVVGWWPCNAPPCDNFALGPDIDIQVTIAGASMPGDADNKRNVNLSDITYLMNWLFEGGPFPPIMNDADANGDCKVNIADVTYLIARIFSGGPAPLDNDCVPGSLKLTPDASGDPSFALTDDVSLDIVTGENGKRTALMATNRNIHGLALFLRALNGSQLEVTNLTNMDMYWSQQGSDVRIGLIDIAGKTYLSAKDTALLEITGDFEFVTVQGTEILADGTTVLFGPEFTSAKFIGGSILPREISFDAIYPNPFNPVTNLAFSLPKDAEVRIEIYNILGQQVRTLTSQKYPAGKHTVQWDSQNDEGQTVASGIYFARFVSGEFVAKKKMLMLK